MGLSLADLLGAPSFGGEPHRGRAKACILIFMEGGPAHQDLWDLKPEAPAEVRGKFKPIATRAPGIHICEHLPMLAAQFHRATLVRSVHHQIADHNAGAYYALTGRSPSESGRLIVRDEPENFPPYGAVVASQIRIPDDKVPPFVHVPDIMSNNGADLPGQRAGFLGHRYDPLITGDPSVKGFKVSGLPVMPGVTDERMLARRDLLERFDRRVARQIDSPAVAALDTYRRQAFELVCGAQARRAFDLSREPQAVRERYGLPDRVDRSVEARQFGGLPHLGQSMLLARRLIEAGVRLVTVGTGRRYDQAWDTHRQHFALLEKSLLPYFDRALSALLEDLANRGMLEETLVVAMGEFGRTPKLGQITSPTGADAGGRDHWPHCYSILLAGGGIAGGQVWGASDRIAAYPARDPVTPEDVAATIYHALGLSPDTLIRDPLGREHPLAVGKALEPLFG